MPYRDLDKTPPPPPQMSGDAWERLTAAIHQQAITEAKISQTLEIMQQNQGKVLASLENHGRSIDETRFVTEALKSEVTKEIHELRLSIDKANDQAERARNARSENVRSVAEALWEGAGGKRILSVLLVILTLWTMRAAGVTVAEVLGFQGQGAVPQIEAPRVMP